MGFASGFGMSNKPTYYQFAGKTGNIQGDSIVNYWNPFTILKSALGITTLNNYGVNGARIADPFGAPSNQLCYSYANMNANVDFNILMAGVNDCASFSVPGTSFIGTNTSATTATLKGAINVWITGMLARYPDKPLIVLTPSYADTPASNISPDEVVIVAAAMKEVCDYRSIPCLNLNTTAGINAGNLGTYTSDTLHLNTAGYAKIMEVITPFMQTIPNLY
jgi:lysophospholipase L1-like esterase